LRPGITAKDGLEGDMEILLGVLVVLLVIVVALQLLFLRAQQKPGLELSPLQAQLLLEGPVPPAPGLAQ
jgi:hypothetical protein